MEKIIEIRNLYKTYENTQALIDVSLDINEGEFLVILGSSGSGKSTLLNIIGGIESKDKGMISYFGKSTSLMNDNQITKFRKNNIGFVFQSFNLIDELTALENLILVCDDKKRCITALNAVGLKDKINSYPSKLSGGQKQRISIARALVNSPKILLCDEPTGALDYETGRSILSLIEEINKKLNTTIVFVTHTREISKMADRVISIRSGKIESIKTNKTKLRSKDIEW